MRYVLIAFLIAVSAMQLAALQTALNRNDRTPAVMGEFVRVK